MQRGRHVRGRPAAPSVLSLLLLFCLQPDSVVCHVKCSESGFCPSRYLCCYNQLSCPLSERVAELAGAVSGVALLFGGVVFCCVQCCRTRIRYGSTPVARMAAATPGVGSGVDGFTEISPLIGAERGS